jgi:hypothetical protein
MDTAFLGLPCSLLVDFLGSEKKLGKNLGKIGAKITSNSRKLRILYPPRICQDFGAKTFLYLAT